MSLNVLGSDLEKNGCVLEVDRFGVGVELTLRSPYGERLGSGLTARGNLLALALPEPMRLYCGDMQIGPSPDFETLEIRDHADRVLGYIRRSQIVELVQSLWRY